MPKDLDRDQFFKFANNHRQEYEDLLQRFVETPTVSCDPAHAEDIQKGVQLTVETLRRFGGKADVYEVSKGNPVVHGVFGNDKNRPTVTVYNHIDVQPASKETEPWDTEPFVMTRKGDSYFGRGTTDDKGPALAALYGARAAMEAGIPVNIRFLWEFEEEIGSPNFEKIIKKAAARPAHRISRCFRYGLGFTKAPGKLSRLARPDWFSSHARNWNNRHALR